jgi:hypothetical protein
VRDTVPPAIVCPSVSPAECTGPNGAAVSLAVTATDACSPELTIINGRTAGGADGSGVYPLGTTPVDFAATDGSGNVARCTAPVTVKDTSSPTLTVQIDRPSLWPPNHGLVPVHVSWETRDLCDPGPAVSLVSVTSSEPDDAPGLGDGETIGDISGAELGTADDDVDLRSERDGRGPGRVYELTYRAVDASGSATPSFVVVTVPHDQGSGPEPLVLRLESDGDAGLVRIYWAVVAGVLGYDVISGDLSQLKVEGHRLSLGAVNVLARGITGTSISEGMVGMIPSPGTALFYLIQQRTDRGGAGYGTESAPWPRVPESCSGGCP